VALKNAKPLLIAIDFKANYANVTYLVRVQEPLRATLTSARAPGCDGRRCQSDGWWACVTLAPGRQRDFPGSDAQKRDESLNVNLSIAAETHAAAASKFDLRHRLT